MKARAWHIWLPALCVVLSLSGLLSCRSTDKPQDSAAGLQASAAPRAGRAQAQPRFSALIFSKTGGYRHDSIDEGIAAITALGAAHQFQVDATENAAVFADAQLASYQVVIFLNTTGDVLDGAQQAAFERFI